MLKLAPEQVQAADYKRILQYLIGEHSPQRLQKLQDYYEGDHDITNRRMADTTKPNNRLVNNLAAFITDTVTGYFMGKPVSYSSEKEGNEVYLEALTDIFDYNDEQDHNAELAKTASIKGRAYELLYTDEEGRVRFAELPAEEVIYVEADTVTAEPLLAVRRYEIHDFSADGKRVFYDLYTDREIVTFEETAESEIKSLVEIEKRPHFFRGVPIIHYPNNKELMGDFEGVISLIDAYNKSQSDTANDFEYFTDAYLVVTGGSFDTEDGKTVASMKEQRALELPEGASADWLIKNVNDTAVENYKDRLRQDIHALSKTPNITDEQFAGNLSGVAISYKILGLEWLASQKERKFKRALQRRIELITNILNAQGNKWDWRHVDLTFSRNIPQNLKEIVEMVEQLRDIVSEITRLSLLPFVDDPQAEQERMEAERETVDLDAVEPEEPEDELNES